MTDGEGRTEERVGFLTRVWRSIVRGPVVPRDDRDRKWIVVNNLILHLRPLQLPAKTLRYTHTFGLGGMSLVLFLLLAATGILLMFVYEPTPERAYGSILTLQNEVLFGKLVRSIHHWSANFLIAIVALHLLRVYFTGGYVAPRQFNWVIGLFLLFCVLASNFTGYLMPWDQLSYWAITISTSMIGYVPLAGDWLQRVVRGGPEIGSATLINFYTLHTTIIPVTLVLLMAWHFWRVRKAHGVVVPRGADEEPDEKPERVLTLPNLLLREFVVATVLVAFVMVFSVFVNAPLDEAANPGMSPNPAKAPWYFVGIQELLLHVHPLFAVLIVPLLVAVALFLIPYLRYEKDTSGIFLMSREGRRSAAIAAAAALVVTPVYILIDEWWIDFGGWLPGLAPVIGNGLLPAAIGAAALLTFYAFIKKRFAVANNEAIQASFVFLAVAFTILTVTGVWFRGSGMALVWPWNL
ncbi:MAG: cytochrome b N-terminal domain-containing protein [Gemmatimonadota bacterium]|nr:MAG: cytochrome b N-terminal domain-containing protein [Gemmatimonadota bacterium]